MIETRLLRQFLVVAEELHFGRAAVRLHIAQPPLSQAMLRLEEKIGAALFQRNSRHVELTAAGRVFRERAQEVLRLLADAVTDAQSAALAHQVLVVSGVQFRGYDFLLSALKCVCGAPPSARMDLRQGATVEQMAWLQARETDVAFVRGLEDLGAHFAHDCVAMERLYAVVDAQHPLAHCAQVALADLSAETFILPARKLGTAYHELLVQLCQQAGFSPSLAHEVANMQTVVGLVEAKMGISIVPASVVAHSEGVRFVRLKDPSPEVPAQMPLFMVWAADHPSPLRDMFIAAVRERMPQREMRAASAPRTRARGSDRAAPRHTRCR